MIKKLIVCHISTAAGARFSIHESEDELRTSLIEYNNETLNDGEDESQLEDFASLEEAIEMIEDCENVSWEELWFNPEEFGAP